MPKKYRRGHPTGILFLPGLGDVQYIETMWQEARPFGITSYVAESMARTAAGVPYRGDQEIDGREKRHTLEIQTDTRGDHEPNMAETAVCFSQPWLTNRSCICACMCLWCMTWKMGENYSTYCTRDRERARRVEQPQWIFDSTHLPRLAHSLCTVQYMQFSTYLLYILYLHR